MNSTKTCIVSQLHHMFQSKSILPLLKTTINNTRPILCLYGPAFPARVLIFGKISVSFWNKKTSNFILVRKVVISKVISGACEKVFEQNQKLVTVGKDQCSHHILILWTHRELLLCISESITISTFFQIKINFDGFQALFKLCRCILCFGWFKGFWKMACFQCLRCPNPTISSMASNSKYLGFSNGRN